MSQWIKRGYIGERMFEVTGSLWAAWARIRQLEDEHEHKITKEELLVILKHCVEEAEHDREVAHSNADKALINFINDEEIRAVYDSIEMWYA